MEKKIFLNYFCEIGDKTFSYEDNTSLTVNGIKNSF